MSLRDALRQSVASVQEKCCAVAVPRGCNNATNRVKTATLHATTHAASPPKPSNGATVDATNHATSLQQTLKNRATIVQQTTLNGTAELSRLVRVCGEFYGFTEAEHTEAFAVALADFNSAMMCFSMMEKQIKSGR